MTEELPDFLPSIKPLPAPPQLRARVLAAIEHQLARTRKPRWERTIELAVAASLVLGVGLSVWRWQVDVPQLAADDRTPPTIAQVAELITWATDAETGRAVARSLQSSWPEPRACRSDAYERYLQTWADVAEARHL